MNVETQAERVPENLNVTPKSEKIRSSGCLILAKHPGQLYMSNRRFKAGEWIVYFPRAHFVSKDEGGAKSFRNLYVRPYDLKKYPEFDETRRKLEERHGDLERFRPKVEWRR